MAFDYNKIDLPVREIIPDVCSSLQTENALIVQAPPGAGKSTLLPLALLNEPWLEGKKIYMLEPRRLAARSIATRMADLLGEKVGETIGYRVRFESKVSDKTKIEVLTEGILTRLIQSDNTLENVGMVIFDEFHERSIHADLAMALTREVQQVLRDDLRILVMSATLDFSKLEDLLGCKSILSEGKQYPVDVQYSETQGDPWLLPELTAKAVSDALKKDKGDILVFLPGQGEIRKTEGLLKKGNIGALIYPLYGQLPKKQQDAAIFPNKEGARKVVLATSIAETSLTIEGIKVVIDSGFGRTSKFDPKTGISKLETVRVSIDSADQRAGRAGRLSPGKCYRLWTKGTQMQLKEHRVPEIMEADLCSMVLDLAQWGIHEPDKLHWLTPPPKKAYFRAIDTLENINALEDGKITEHGKKVNKIPCHPRLAHMLLHAEELEQLPLACDLAAIIEERDPLPKDSGVDINLRIEALRRYRKNNGKGGKLGQIEKIANSYRKIFDIEPANDFVDSYETGYLLALAFPERIACAKPGNNAQFQLSNGTIAQMSYKDDLSNEPWMSVAHIDGRNKMGKIFLASPLDPKDLMNLLQEREEVSFDLKTGELRANLELRIGSIILKSTPLPDPEPEAIQQVIIQALKKNGEKVLNFNDEDVQLFQNRIISLKHWNPTIELPDVSTEYLIKTCEEWLAPYLTNVTSTADLNALDLRQILEYSLSNEERELIDKLAPEKIEVPSGSKIKMIYRNDGEAPILPVKIQELFGMPDTPVINNGKTKVLIQMLSPGFKPVQLTADLKNFWENTYAEVRKELRGRYLKHYWPENPLEAEATTRTKKSK